LSTNSAWLSRYNQTKLSLANTQLDESLNNGHWDPEALYILENEKIFTVLQLADPTKDLIAFIDGYYVLAPNWKLCHECLMVANNQEIFLKSFTNLPGEVISFGKTSYPKYLLSIGNGWAHRESWGVWSDGILATLTLLLPPQGANYLELNARAFVTPTHKVQDIEMTANGRVTNFSLSKSDGNLIKIPITKADWKIGYLNIRFYLKNPIRPKDIGEGDDARLLAIGLEKAIFK